MMFRTHAAFGLLVGLLSIQFIHPENILLFVLLATIFSMVPDIDEKQSKIGRRLKFLSYPIEFIFRHRGLFHTVYLPIFIFLIFLLFDNFVYGIAAALGYISHLILDALTLNGIRPLQPILKFRIRGFVKTNSILEFIIFLLILTIDLFGILYYIL